MDRWEEKVIDLLASLVKISSVSRKESEASNALAENLPSFGWKKAYIDAVGNVVAHRGKGKNELILLGHIDTVPGGPPFSLDENYLIGRGAVDAKGPLCAMAVAGGSCDLPEDWKITFIAAVGEEEDSRGAKFRLKAHSPKGCIIGEPTGTYGIATSCRGRILAKISSADKGAHRSWSSGPMTKTLLAAAKIIEDIASPVKDRGSIDNISCSVISMRGEENHGRAGEVLLDLRIPVGMHLENIISRIEELCNHFEVNVSVLDTASPHQVAKNDKMVIALRRAIRSYGQTLRLLAKSGTNDFNTVAPWGCPMAIFGPGDSILEHTEYEKINLKEYLAAINILKEGIQFFINQNN
ncbi:MAG: M20/M25/M40 family metallo-hydrolase [Thermovirga sp.]|nr:M20/M25/M40 family metallo-hydrolase [Thermovirga sp.]